MLHRKILRAVFLSVSGIIFGNMLLFSENLEVYQLNEETVEVNGEAVEENENELPLTPEARITNIEDKLIAFEEKIEIALNPRNPVTPDENSLSRGRSLYIKQCRDCHGSRGRGDGVLSKAIQNVGDFSDPNLWNKSDQELFDMITDSPPPMPSYRTMKEKDRWHLVNYIRTFAPKPAQEPDEN